MIPFYDHLIEIISGPNFNRIVFQGNLLVCAMISGIQPVPSDGDACGVSFGTENQGGFFRQLERWDSFLTLQRMRGVGGDP